MLTKKSMKDLPDDQVQKIAKDKFGIDIADKDKAELIEDVYAEQKRRAESRTRRVQIEAPEPVEDGVSVIVMRKIFVAATGAARDAGLDTMPVEPSDKPVLISRDEARKLQDSGAIKVSL